MSIEKVFAESANLIPEKKRMETLEAFVATLPSILPFAYAGKIQTYCDELEETVPQLKIIKSIPKIIRETVFNHNEAIAMMYVKPEEFVQMTIEKYNELTANKNKITKADSTEFLRTAIIRATKHFLNEIVEGTR